MRLVLALAASFALLGLVCEADLREQARDDEREVIPIHADERALLEGVVLEQLVAPGSPYVYLRVDLDAGGPRWIALPLDERERALVGERVRVRSLGGRSHVWVEGLELDWLEYGAPLE